MKIDRNQIEEFCDELQRWIDETRRLSDDFIQNLQMKEENRKRSKIFKSFINEIHFKESFIENFKDKCENVEEISLKLNQFADELKEKNRRFDEFLRVQQSIDDYRENFLEKFSYLMDRLSLWTKTDCDSKTLEKRLEKVQVRRYCPWIRRLL